MPCASRPASFISTEGTAEPFSESSNCFSDIVTTGIRQRGKRGWTEKKVNQHWEKGMKFISFGVNDRKHRSGKQSGEKSYRSLFLTAPPLLADPSPSVSP